MDDPNLDPKRHTEALRGLERINRISGSVRAVWPPIRELARQTDPTALRVLDIGSGAGDVPIGLWHAAQRRGLSLHVNGCDMSPHAVAHARQRAARSGARVGFTVLNALADELPTGYDVVTSSLLLHHLTDDRAVQLLRKMAKAAGRLVLINDLRRSIMGLILACVGTRLLTRSSVVHTDGPRSVHAAFTIDEVLRHAQQAGLEGAQVVPRWPFRYVLSWRRP